MASKDTGTVSVDNYSTVIETIDLFRTSPGLADLFRRLYQIRIDCGQIDSGISLEKQKLQETKAYKKLDKFERQKVSVKQAIDLAESKLKQKKDQKNRTDHRLNNEINKAISQMEKEMRELVEIQNKVPFSWKGNSMPIEIKKQRENDIKNFKEYIKLVKHEHVKLLTGLDEDGSTLITDVKFDSIESLQQARKEIPTVDISEGLEQIEQAKSNQEGTIDILLGQVQQIKGVADSISVELDKQAQLLDTMSLCVDKYNNHLENTNRRMANAIQKAGGPTRLLIILIILIVIVGLLGVGWLLLELFVPDLSRF